MVTPALIGYINAELKKGKDRDTIKGELVSGGGWKMVDVAEAFAAIDLEASAKAATLGTPATPGVAPIMNIGKPHRKVRLVWVAVLVLLAGYAGWWIRDRQQFFHFPVPFVRS